MSMKLSDVWRWDGALRRGRICSGRWCCLGSSTTLIGRWQLEGTTWYRHNLWPATYWQVWSDYIIHRIHLRVLEHIKERAEL